MEIKDFDNGFLVWKDGDFFKVANRYTSLVIEAGTETEAFLTFVKMLVVKTVEFFKTGNKSEDLFPPDEETVRVWQEKHNEHLKNYHGYYKSNITLN